MLAHKVQNGPEVYDAHAVDHLLHGCLEAFAGTFIVHLHLLLDLYEARPESMEEVRFEVVGVVLSNKLDDDAY